MKIFIDIGHPAHVHYFKNTIKILKNSGHQIKISARNKEMAQYLLSKNKFEYFDRGKGSENSLGKLFYMIKTDYMLYQVAKRFNPDLFLSYSSPYTAHISRLLKKKSIALDDTEHARLGRIFYKPFTDFILSPKCFELDLGPKQHKFDSFLELFYLHSNYFSPDQIILDMLGVNKGEKYSIIRFVNWTATHDIGFEGINLQNKYKLVNELSKHSRVFISSECRLPDDLLKFQIPIPPEYMHDALAYAHLLIGESATMASEAAMLGTPAIYFDKFGRGYTNELEKRYGLVNNFSNNNDQFLIGIEQACKILENESSKSEANKSRERLLSEKIDPTKYLIDFIYGVN